MNMNDEAPVIFKDKVMPLFVDTNVRIVCMGIFFWKNSSTPTSSYFPIIVQPPNFRNLYVSLYIMDSEDKKISLSELQKNDKLKQILEKERLYQKDHPINDLKITNIQFIPIDKFDPLQYCEYSDDGTATFVFLNKDTNIDSPDFSQIVQEILNPLGIGVFYSNGIDFAQPLRRDKIDNSFENSKYCQAPFSMEIIDRLLYNPKLHVVSENEKPDTDISKVDVLSLMSLQYPLKPLTSSIDDSLRKRLIFCRITLRYPPTFFVRDKLRGNYKLADKIDPYTWVVVKLKRKIQTQAFAMILVNKSEKIEIKDFINLKMKDIQSDSLMNRNIWDAKAQNVFVQFKNQKVAIMSPYGGYLRVYCDEDNLHWSAKVYQF